MSNQQGLASRPWFRLASMMRPPPPPTTPAPSAANPQTEPLPPPRPAFIRPTFRAPSPPPPQEPTRPPPPPAASPPPPPPSLPSVVSPPPTTVVTPTPAPAPSPSPRIVAPSPSLVPPAPTTPPLRFVGTAPSPTVVTPPSSQIVVPLPSPTVVPPAPTTPSPRIVDTAPSPTVATPSRQIVATQPPPSPAAPQVPATNGSSIPPSPITKAPFPSFSSPKPKLATPSSSSPASKPVPLSPPPPTQSPSPSRVSLASSTNPTATIAHTITPVSSPKMLKPLEKTPPPFSSTNTFSHPPSPLTLPPPQIKSDAVHETRSPPIFEQKAVVVQETKEKPKASPKNSKGDLHKPIGETHSPKRDITKEIGNHKKYSDSEDFGTRIITMTGENKGAIMELSPSRRTAKFGDIKKGSPISWSDDEKSGSNIGDIAKEKNRKAIPTPMTAFMNSNVQGVNNSILYNCSTTHHDPGVHFSVSRKPNGSNGIYLKNYGNGSHD